MLIPDLNLSPTELAKIKRERSHWNKVAQMLYATKTKEDILAMLYCEFHTHNRPYVIRRIYSHYNAVRRRHELEELENYDPKEHIFKELS